jgi:large subunit ribosomal protein L25
MQTISLEAQDRSTLGTSNTRRLRRQGLIPAVLYGKKLENLNLAVSREAFDAVMRHHGRLLDVKLPGGKTEKAMIKEVQWDTYGDEVLHVDLGRVALTDKIHIKVELKFIGEAKGLSQGGHLDIHIHEAMIECLAGNIPDQIRVDVSAIELDQQLRVKDLAGKLPEGVRIMEDENVAVVGVKMIHLEELPVAGAAPTEAGATEPEVITKGKKDEEGEAEAEEKK